MRRTALGVLLVVASSCASTASAPTIPSDKGRRSESAAASNRADGPPGSRRMTMAFTGDTLMHSPLWERAQDNAGGAGYDFTPMQARLEPLLDSADLAVCHLETPIAPEGEVFTTAPLYGVPPEVVDGLVAAGYDRCSTASNHTMDRGAAGIDRTVNVLESRGIEQSGMARTPDEIAPKVFELNGIAVTHLAYTFGLNTLTLPSGEEWRSALIEPGRIITDANAARSLGAEVVVVSMHWGEERIAELTPDQLAVADTLTASGAVDLIIGHHAHVLQPIDKVNGRWVVYGLGNIVSDLAPATSWPASSQDAAVAMIAMTVGADGDVIVERPVIHPTWVDRDAGWIVRLVQPDLADPGTPEGIRAELYASFGRTKDVLGPYVADG